jgi:xylulokinase
VFFGLTHETTRGELGRAVLEGVAYAFADGQDVLTAGKTPINQVTVIGGGARSELWGRILASVLQRPLLYREGGEAGPAYGAARLARLAHTGENPETVCSAPPVVRVVEPNPTLQASYKEKVLVYREIYNRMKSLFAEQVSSKGENV